ncbi:putative porin [Methylotenera mobilis]|uniref:Porin n=1 Tax=Methylotenera mobilis (strain JLW8 / ATCC BAA-1282 / DSM 17540) TaxID=583345 RepID=C6WXE0_METML|nr:putative porin [Methylotenera mobilis]ACT48589.1 hypothetical protein Mmol_1685 [Methylotenera mobilis JLW8]
MNYKLRSLVAASLTGALMLGVAQQASADSTTDIVNALVAKGVLTEEEGALLTKGREMESVSQAKAMKKASKLKVSDAIDNAELYGDIRVRVEQRNGEDVAGKEQDRTRDRYKLTLGVKTESGNFYTDLALAMGQHGRSDNATFGSASGGSNGSNTKEAAYIKRAMVGYKATDWLALEAGRVANPLYTTQMVWDSDLTFEGLVEKANFKVGDNKFFLTGVQSQYLGDTRKYGGTATTADSISNWIMAFQAGAEVPLADGVKGKAALTYTTYSNNDRAGKFVPAIGSATTLGTNVVGTNNLRTIEIPAELNFSTSGPLSYSLFGDYVKNLDGNDRRDAAVAGISGAANKAKLDSNDDSAWLLGVGINYKAGPKVAKGDWSAKLWYQDVGVYAVDPNAVDSDFMDSKVNMKGVVLKTQYNLQENVFINFAAGHATNKNDKISTAGVAGDLGYNLKSYDLYQLDLTYRF